MTSPRRYYMLKRLAARQLGLDEGVWISRQGDFPGTTLPTDFPFRSQLVSAGYSTSQDLEDAGPDELSEFVGLGQHDYDAVTAALAAM